MHLKILMFFQIFQVDMKHQLLMNYLLQLINQDLIVI